MKSLHVTGSAEAFALMTAAAEYEELPISLWARVTLLKEARAVAHRKLCAATKAPEYKWLGEPCTKEEFEEKSKNSLAVKRK